ncbi:MAG: hypothetical protein K2Z81_18725, partial [Cyanobacteria bacterium]|nr:hypothetical protein [Cyanobacteriota bacterium]
MTKSDIHIVTATDEGYFPHFCAMLHSAWLYNPEANFYLLDVGVSPASLDKLREFAGLKKIKLSIIPAADRIRAELPNYKYRATFSRVLIPELLPAELNRVAYLDSDMTVVGDLGELFEIDLGGNA